MFSLLGCSWLPLLLCLPAVLPSWFPSGLLLAATVALSPSCSPFPISLLVCSWLPLLPCLPAGLPSSFPFYSALDYRPSWFPFWAALGCHCCFVSQLFSLPDFPSGLLLSVFLISLLGWCWLPLLPCLLLSPCMISLLGCSWLPLSPSLFAFMGPFWAALGCSCCHDFPSHLSRLPLPPYLPSWFPFWAALGCLVFQFVSRKCYLGSMPALFFIFAFVGIFAGLHLGKHSWWASLCMLHALVEVFGPSGGMVFPVAEIVVDVVTRWAIFLPNHQRQKKTCTHFKHIRKEVILLQAAILAKTYDGLIRELDALDNGVQVADRTQHLLAGGPF